MDAAAKVFKLLEVFLEKEKVSVSELAGSSGLSLSTAHRVTAGLVKQGYLRQEGKRGKYSLSLKFLEFSRAILNRLEITDIARPFLHELNNATGETVSMVVLDRDEAVQVTRIESRHVLRVFTAVGRRVALQTTSTGKILLANLREAELQKYVDVENLPDPTPNSITSLERLRKEIDRVRREGIAVDDEESNIGVRSVAAPIRDWSGKVMAAVAVVGPVARLDNSRMQELKPRVKGCGTAISRALGYAGPDND